MNRIEPENETYFHQYYLDAFVDALDKPSAIREVKARYNFYTKAPIYINPGELIVGNIDWALDKEVVINRISAHYVQRRLIEKIKADPEILPEIKEALDKKLEIFAPYILFNRVEEILTDEEQLAKESGIASSCHFNGHMVLDFGYVLDKGFSGILEDIKRYRDRPLSPEQESFYEAMEITTKGMMAFIQRHAEKAQELIAAGDQGYDSELLTAIRDNCNAIAEGKPQNFLQALQTAWFLMGFADYDSYGRFDQYIYPFYIKSKQEGMTDDKALDYLKYLWDKLDQNGAIINMTIGGVKPDGTDGVNELTYLILEITRKLKYKGPNLCLRIRSDSPDRLWEEAYKSLSAGQALPALYNEELILKMLEGDGIEKEDALDFALAGCSQVIIPARSSYACDMGEYVALKSFELALHDGYDARLGVQVGPHTGRATELNTYEKLLDAYREQVKYAVKMGVSINNKDHIIRKDDCSCVRSLLTRGCLEKGKGIFQGAVKYYGVQNEIIGLTNTANSLMAVKKAVFEEKKLSLADLVDILDRNFEEHEDLRQYLLNRTPKFGNDENEVDEIRAMITREYFTELNSNKSELGGYHMPGEVIFHYHISHKGQLLASPDGRKAFEPLADSAGPSQGTELNGPTAIINSMLKLPLILNKTCCCLNMKFTKSLWKNGREKVMSMFRSYFERGGYQLQINVVDREELLEAKKNPEKHRSLVVRVGGYSAYFVHLAPDIQDDIIARTEHAL